MEGQPISTFMGSEIATNVKNKISALCCDLLLEMVFLKNFVHGDLHPGNILVKKTKTGHKVVFLDCGIVTSVTDDDHKTFIDICLSLLQFNGREAGKRSCIPNTILTRYNVTRACHNSNANLA
jgi:aarF domain-containing kinase